MARRPAKRRSPPRRGSPVYLILAAVVLGLGALGVTLTPDLARWLPPELRAWVMPAPTPRDRPVSRPRRDPAPGELPRTPLTFAEAKRVLYGQIYRDHPWTLYCGCAYAGRAVDLASCGVEPRRNPERAARVEAEHVFPAAQFGHFRACWRQPAQVCGQAMAGRTCCEQTDTVFRTAHNDLHNLYPAEGEINGDRRDYNWGMVPGPVDRYGHCEIRIDPSIRRVEPPDTIKGDIARTMFYMSDTYRFNLADQDRQLFTAWARLDPPDGWERERNRRIAAIQGRGNRFIETDAVAAGTAPADRTAAAPP